MGIRGGALNLIKSFLSNRLYKVRINSSTSDELVCNIGLPQGSILSPLLFLVYINDLFNFSTDTSIVLFADDTTLIFQDEDYDNLVSKCNSVLTNFREWTYANRLSLNVDKTFSMLFTNRRIVTRRNLYFGTELIREQEECVFLGVKIYTKLKFYSHTRSVHSKISKSIGILFKLSTVFPLHILKIMYYSLIYPYLHYCNIIWSGTYQTHIKPLAILQKRAIRVISGESYLSHTNSLFYQHGILKFTDINTYLTALFMFKNLNNFNTFSNHNYRTRGRFLLRPQFQRTVITQQSIKYRGPKTWNSLPNSIKSIRTLPSFKLNLRKLLISQYR